MVTLIFYLDFFLTFRLVGNYKYLIGEIDEYLDSEAMYKLIIIVQAIDILFNFFRITHDGNLKIDEPIGIITNYLSGNFLLDFVTILPLNMIDRHLIVIRLFKLNRFNER